MPYINAKHLLAIEASAIGPCLEEHARDLDIEAGRGTFVKIESFMRYSSVAIHLQRTASEASLLEGIHAYIKTLRRFEHWRH